MSKELNPSTSTASATGNPRNKTALKPGYSLIGWIRLTNSGEDLTGLRGKIINVSHQELSKHNTENDCWMAIRGKVYNVSRYLEFHPGGAEQLMRGAGKDATSLFDEYHAWVNIESLLAKCFVGPLRTTVTLNLGDDIFSKKPTLISGLSPTKKPVNKSIDDGASYKHLLALSLERTTQKSLATMTSSESENVPVIPRFDWIQKSSELAIFFYTKAYANPGILVRYISDKNIEIYIFIANAVDCYNFTFLKSLSWPCDVKLNCESGKIEIIFQKMHGEIWTNFGTYLKTPPTTTNNNHLSDFMEDFSIHSRQFFNHDSFQMILRPVKQFIMMLPIGSHVNFHHLSPMENKIIRSYTPVPRKFASSSTSSHSEKITTEIFDQLFFIKTYGNGALSGFLSSPNNEVVKLCVKPKGALNLGRLRSCTNFAMFAGGSGITPMISVLNFLLQRKDNRIEALTLFYFNKTEEDIWLREELENIARNDDRFQVKHMFSESTAQPRSYLNKEIVESIRKTTEFIFICGPLKFNELAVDLIKDTCESSDGNIDDDFWVFQ